MPCDTRRRSSAWSRSLPEALGALSTASAVDYILVDKAQGLNPVLLGILKRMDGPVVYVGDPYQQIFEWRGR
jgi:superfamily I DNA/RNA helicase